MTKRHSLQLLVTVSAILVVVVHHSWPDLKADAFTGTFLIVAILPWLSPLLRSVKLPGGVEIELRAEIEEARAQASSAVHQAEVAVAQAAATHSYGKVESAALTAAERLRNLGKQYVETRAAMPSGDERTSAMTRIMGEMLAVATDAPGTDVSGYFDVKDPGKLLAAYAYVHAHPDPKFIWPIVETLVDRRNKPFTQYWALRALRRIAASRQTAQVATNDICVILRSYAEGLNPGTDRHYEAYKLLGEIGCQ